ncbi:MAG: cupin domain-containing protein [Bacteroidota bacterium]
MEITHRVHPSGQSPRGVAVQKLVDIPAAVVMRMALKPGEEVAPHLTPVDVLFYIESGSGRISIGREEEPVSAGDLVVSPKEIPHGLTAGPDGMMLLVIKVPRPK